MITIGLWSNIYLTLEQKNINLKLKSYLQPLQIFWNYYLQCFFFVFVLRIFFFFFSTHYSTCLSSNENIDPIGSQDKMGMAVYDRLHKIKMCPLIRDVRATKLQSASNWFVSLGISKRLASLFLIFLTIIVIYAGFRHLQFYDSCES